MDGSEDKDICPNSNREKDRVVHAYPACSERPARVSHQLGRVDCDNNRALCVAKGLAQYFVFVLYWNYPAVSRRDKHISPICELT